MPAPPPLRRPQPPDQDANATAVLTYLLHLEQHTIIVEALCRSLAGEVARIQAELDALKAEQKETVHER